MSSDIPPCKNPIFLFTLIGLKDGINERAAQQAEAYIQKRLDPVKEDMKNQVSGIATVVILILVFFIILPMLVYIIWIAYELGADSGVMMALMLVFLIISLVLVYLVVSVVSNTINTVINTATRQVVALDNPQAIGALVASLNGAAAQYVQKTTGSATCLTL